MKRLLLFFSCILVFTGGCADSPDRQLLGTWLRPTPDNPQVTQGFEFKKHGKMVTIRSSASKYNAWRISENNILILSGNDTSSGGTLLVTDYYTITSLSKSMLVLSNNNGGITYYTRAE